MTTRCFFWGLILLGSCCGGMGQEVLALQKTIALAGVEGRFDHAAADEATHRLFFAALGNNTLEVVDLAGGKRLHTITGLKEPTGVAFLPEEKLLVVASGGDGSCRFYDAATYAEKGRVKELEDADNVRFDAKAKRVYVGYGEGALGVIDATTMKLVRSIALPKHPESFQLERNGPRIFVNVPGAKQIAVIDREEGKVVARWPLTDFTANFPMALDEAGHRLFVGCRSPARLLVIDTKAGGRVADAPLSGDIDDLFFEREGARLLASCGEGFIDLFRVDPAGHATRTSKTKSAGGARTSFFNPSLGYALAVPHRGGQGAEIRLFQTAPGP